MLRSFLAPLTALMLIGCAGGAGLGSGVVIHSEGYLRYSAGDHRYAFGHLGLPVVVHGNPFAGVSHEAFAQAVIASMPGNERPPLERFSAARPGEQGGARVVLSFNGPQSQYSHGLCRHPDTLESYGPGSPASVNAAFCEGDEALSWVSGSAPLAGPDDPNLDRLMNGIVLRLFPPENPHHRPNGNGRGRMGLVL